MVVWWKLVVSTGSFLPIGFCLTASIVEGGLAALYLFLADKLTSLFCQALGTILIEDALLLNSNSQTIMDKFIFHKCNLTILCTF